MDVPPEHRQAAEIIRRHLVAHRGGAVFLSSSDALRLIDWLDREIPVEDILRAIERAAESRAKNRSRVPLSLGHVGRHLGKPTRGVFKSRNAPPVQEHETGLAALVRVVRERAIGDMARELLEVLADDLAELVEGPDLAQLAMTRLRIFHEAVFDGLSEARRAALRDAARDDLGDLVHMMDERELAPLVEEAARYEARRGYGWLSAASVWDLLQPEEPT